MIMFLLRNLEKKLTTNLVIEEDFGVERFSPEE